MKLRDQKSQFEFSPVVEWLTPKQISKFESQEIGMGFTTAGRRVLSGQGCRRERRGLGVRDKKGREGKVGKDSRKEGFGSE
jgi:hypothetical protein